LELPRHTASFLCVDIFSAVKYSDFFENENVKFWNLEEGRIRY
jgi:hypothetical protein